MPPAPRILGISTALPEERFEQARAVQALRRWLAEGPPPEIPLERVVRVFENAGVETRHSLMPVEALLTERPLGEKNRAYMEGAKRLGEAALRALFDRTGVAPGEVDLFITTSCTGFMIPSLDAHLMNRLPFRPDVRRLPVTELGCAAGAAAFRLALDHLRAYPGHTVLVLAAEFPTMNFQPSDRSADHLISTAIFGDGVAAMLLGDRPGPGLRVLETSTRFFPGTSDFMGFDVEATGFHIFLSPKIPAFVAADLVPALRGFLSNGDGAPVDAWLVHPGGPKILDSFEDALGLPRRGLRESRDVLRRVGNLSSATVFFVLERYLEAGVPREGARQVVAAVGPGFQADAALLEWRGASA